MWLDLCGISGLVGLKHDESIINRFLTTMNRRGPDDVGVYDSEECVLMHSRLAVIDLFGGAQPMELIWAGEKYIIVYNGELYNTDEVRSALIRKGHVFKTHSDTEVILHAFAQWKEASLDRLNGIFSFAIWQDQAKELFIARDRMGVKPLFYSLYQGGLIFASEIKTILQYPDFPRRLTKEGAAQLLLLGPGRIPGSGVIDNIYELEPGCCGYYDGKILNITRYWTLTDGEHLDSFEETVEKVRYLVTDAIIRQTVSDVPIGSFLSGGLDSSIISAICSGQMKEKGRSFDTFSVDYQNNEQYFTPGKFQPESDGRYIQLMRKTLYGNHHDTILGVEELEEGLWESVKARDLPGMADVDASMLQFCKEIRKHVKVALSGECADEIFGGYPWYRDPEIRNADGFPWAQNTAQRKQFLSERLCCGLNAEEYIHEQYLKTIRSSDILPGTDAQERRTKEMVNLNLRWFMQTLLDRKDRMSMYSGLEVRVPFCDHRIAQYLYRVPWSFKDYQGQEKGLLRRAMQGIIPDEVLWRKKSPYPKTYDPGYMQSVSDLLRTVIQNDHEPIHEIVNKNALKALLTSEYKWPWYGQLMKTPQTIAYMLQINFWLKDYHIDIL